MYLKSLTLEGFKSFPKRTRLEFAEGTSVIIGPNGSGKSNIIDAVLWVLGEQSPLAVRGQTMQDIIFGGGDGQRAATFAEVEMVIDNSDATVDLPFAEIAVSRRLNREGEGEYRLNGARARLADVLELLGSAGLGKEMHSVISQGRVDAIVTSKPKDRRLLIEEAAGLGKHRKRKRRAQLKLERTHANLARVLDVEREARSRLKPLKRQAQAAEIHARLDRQITELRLQIAEGDLAHRSTQQEQLKTKLAATKKLQQELKENLNHVAQHRNEAEQQLTAQNIKRDELTRAAYGAQNLLDRIAMQRERLQRTQNNVQDRLQRTHTERAALKEQENQDEQQGLNKQKIVSLQTELAEVDRLTASALEDELKELQDQRTVLLERLKHSEEQLTNCVEGHQQAEQNYQQLKAQHAELTRERDNKQRAVADFNAELATVNQFLRSYQVRASQAVSTLATVLSVQSGYEQAFAVALGEKLGAQIVDDIHAALNAIDGAGEDGEHVLLFANADRKESRQQAPVRGAKPLADFLKGEDSLHLTVQDILVDVWLVEQIAADDIKCDATLVTREGRMWNGRTLELKQLGKAASEERVLAERGRQQALVQKVEEALQAEQKIAQRVSESETEVDQKRQVCEEKDVVLRSARSQVLDLREELAALEKAMQRRKAAPQDGPLAVRRAQLAGELAAEERSLERAQRELLQRQERLATLAVRFDAYEVLLPTLEKAARLVNRFHGVADRYAQQTKVALEEERQRDDALARTLREYAEKEADAQRKVQDQSEQLTRIEVELQHNTDAIQSALDGREKLVKKLGIEPRSLEQLETLTPAENADLTVRIERLVRRREQLGPVNPLAEQEYQTACEHVQELEQQRTDLENALREIKHLMRETDRYIKETFELTFQRAAENFHGLLGHLFPGGKGRLRLIGAQELEDGDEDEQETQSSVDPNYGVEIEITPAGKQMKQLTLLSGGEKALTALAFLFSVFLAQPCPFYILDEVEAALDDVNAERFVHLLGDYAHRAQFIVVTHRKRTMDAADALYGVSMARNGVSKIVSRQLPPKEQQQSLAGAA